MKNWKERSTENHLEFIKRANIKEKLTSRDEICNFLALAICGEAGELANFIKKQWRGEFVKIQDIADELADIRIYLHHLANEMNIDLDEACKRKVTEVSERLKYVYNN